MRKKVNPTLKLYRGETKLEPGKTYATDPGDLGAGIYYTDDRATAKAYSKDVRTVVLKFEHPLVLSASEASVLSEKYHTVHGTEEERLLGARRMSLDLLKLGYDVLIVSGYDTPKGYHTVVDLRTARRYQNRRTK